MLSDIRVILHLYYFYLASTLRLLDFYSVSTRSPACFDLFPCWKQSVSLGETKCSHAGNTP